MSECVVRMEMPSRCCDCDMADGVTCMATGGVYGREVPKMTWIRRRPDWCPIICQLPEGHGELIERQAVYEKIKWWQENTHDTVTKAMLHEFYLMLFGVPAIVPATEGGKHDNR